MAGKAKPSRTARGVLAQRAVLTDMGVVADPFAHEMLTPSMAVIVRVVKRWPAPFRFLPPRTTGTARNRRQRLLQQAARAGSGETLRCLVDRPRAVALVEASGWDVQEADGGPDAARAWLPADSGLPADAVNEHGSYLAASHA